MKNLNFRAASQLILISFCNLFCVYTPAQAQIGFSQPQEQCDKTDCKWGETTLLIGGSIVAGGIAGAVTSHPRHSHRNHAKARETIASTGVTGPAGPTGAAAFTIDECATLTFTFSLTDPIGVNIPRDTPLGNYEANLIAFVSLPDGQIEFKELNATLEVITRGFRILGLITFPTTTIAIDTAIEGTYHVGLHFVNDLGFDTVTFRTFDFSPTVEINNPACSGATKTVSLEAGLVGGITVPSGNSAQISTAFTYDPELVIDQE